jgi:hypothetical protein
VKKRLNSCDHLVNGAWAGGLAENHCGMAIASLSASYETDPVVLERGGLRVEIALRPLP